MTTTDAIEPQPAAIAPRKSFVQRVTGVLFSPGETFDDIARKPDIVAPLLLLLALTILVTVVMVPRIDFESAFRTQMERSNRDMSPQDMERAAKFGKAIGTTMAYAGPVLSVIFWAIIAGVLLLAFRLLGGEGTYAQAFSVTLYSWLPLAIGGIVVAIVILARGTLVDPTTIPTLVKSNPAFLVDNRDNPVAFAFLSSLDVFTIWSVALLSIGFAALSRFSRAKSAAIVVTLWLAVVIVKAGFAALGAAKMKSS
ncbi:MAG TPA: Yip1 family protein [Thermoanaerobaculia bacterium]|jgi:hypothetical protein